MTVITQCIRYPCGKSKTTLIVCMLYARSIHLHAWTFEPTTTTEEMTTTEEITSTATTTQEMTTTAPTEEISTTEEIVTEEMATTEEEVTTMTPTIEIPDIQGMTRIFWFTLLSKEGCGC